MSVFDTLVARTLVMPECNIDTDQIIPARFLTTTTRDGLGRHAFNDWRYLADGRDNPAQYRLLTAILDPEVASAVEFAERASGMLRAPRRWAV